MCESKYLCVESGSIHDVENPKAWPNTQYVKTTKYNLKYHINKQLEQFDLTEDKNKTVAIRIRQILIVSTKGNSSSWILFYLRYSNDWVFKSNSTLFPHSQTLCPPPQKTLIKYERAPTTQKTLTRKTLIKYEQQ